MGEGKSAALCWAIFYHTQHNPGAQWALIRDTWENLQATTLLEFFKWFPKGVMIDWSASQKRATWRRESGLVGSVVCVGMDVPGDAHKLQSRELAGLRDYCEAHGIALIIENPSEGRPHGSAGIKK